MIDSYHCIYEWIEFYCVLELPVSRTRHCSVLESDDDTKTISYVELKAHILRLGIAYLIS